MSSEWCSSTLPPPPSVKIELTSRCNFNCAFCAHSQKHRKNQDMDRGFYRSLVAELAALGVKEVGMFFLGESTILPWLPWAIAEAAEHNFDLVFLTTNGSLVTKDKARDYMVAGLGGLKFSLNYASPHQMSRVAGVKPQLWQDVIDNLKGAYRVRQELGADCGIYVSYIEYDDQQAGEMEPVLREVRDFCDEMYSLPLYSQATLAESQERAEGWAPTPGNRGRAGNLRDPLPCWSIFKEGHVTVDGRLVGCCFSHEPERFDFGDLTQGRFMDAWNSPAARALRSAHLQQDVVGTACEKCVLYE